MRKVDGSNRYPIALMIVLVGWPVWGQEGPQFALGFERCPEEVSGLPGEVKTFEVFATLRTFNNPYTRGARGWSISLTADGATITGISKNLLVTLEDGTEYILGSSPGEGLAIFPADGRKGAISYALLESGKSLAPTGTQRIARLTVEIQIPQEGIARATLRYENGFKGPGEPFKNIIVFDGNSHHPDFDACSIQASVSGGTQIAGDANQDNSLDISDAVWLLEHLFVGTLPTLPCEGGIASLPGPGERELLDVNTDALIDISDAVTILAYLFLGEQVPRFEEGCKIIQGCPPVCIP